MAILDSKFDLLRGWPQSSAVAEEFLIGGTTNHKHYAGQWVILDGATGYTTSDATTIANAASKIKSGIDSADVLQQPALIIEGKEDYSARMSNTVTVLLGGGYVVRLQNASGIAGSDTTYDMFAENAWAAGVNNAGADISAELVPGAPVKVEYGIIYPLVTAGGGTNLLPDLTIGTAIAVATGNAAAVNTAIDTIEGTIQDAVDALLAVDSVVGYILAYNSTDHTLDVFIR